MTDQLKGVIRREMFIAADPATVFAFLTEPEKMTRWMGVRTDLDAKTGGVYLVDVNNQNVARGAFEEVTPNARVVFSFGWEDGAFGITPGSSRIEIDLTPKDGGTALVFVHSGLPEIAVEAHTEGWTHYHGRLAIAAAGGEPGPDPKVKEAA